MSNKDLLDFLLEDNPAPEPVNTHDASPPETPLNVSLDAAVDRYIVRYEKESIPTVENYDDPMYGESVPTHDQVINEALFEAPEDEEEFPEEELPADDELGVEDTPVDAGAGAEQPVMYTPQINLQDFTRSVARLVNNYDALLNPKNTIINRVEKYIETNYDVRTAKEFVEILDKNFGLRADDVDTEEQWPTPQAVGSLSSEG